MFFRDKFRTFASMKEHVTDILEAFNSLQKKLDSMNEKVDGLETTVHQLTRANQRLTKENKHLKQRLSKYETPKKDSSNSGTPPGKENMKSETNRRTQSLREKSNNPVGGQLGHEGCTREVVDNPDEIVNHQSNYCTACGADLSSSERVLDYTTQEIDIPQIEPVIREHRHYLKVCSCGCKNRPYAPRGRGGNAVVFGKNVRALVVYYSVVQCIPYQRMESMLKNVFGIDMSQGTMRNIIQEARKKSEPAIARILEYIKKSKVVGFDESGCYCNGRLDWSWIAQTVYYTLVFRASGRKGQVLTDMFGDSLENMIAVTDRHSAYFALNFLDHQICLAHILRELKYLGEVDEKQKWSAEMESLLKEAIHTRNESPGKRIETKSWIERLDNLLDWNLEKLNEKFRTLRKGLFKCRDYIFKFLEDPLVPPTNNSSERGFRKLKVKNKISGTFRSNDGADAFFSLHSIVETAAKHEQPLLDGLLALF